MLRSMQTSDPATAWSLIYPELAKLDAQERITGEKMNQLLHFVCSGMKAAKDTLHWAQKQGLLLAHREDMPTSYSLTMVGRKWKSKDQSED